MPYMLRNRRFPGYSADEQRRLESSQLTCNKIPRVTVWNLHAVQSISIIEVFNRLRHGEVCQVFCDIRLSDLVACRLPWS
jgi:hypothetical protein